MDADARRANEERIYGLAFLALAGIGSRRLFRLQAHFASLAHAWEAPYRELERSATLGPAALAALEAARRAPESLQEARRSAEALERKGIAMVLGHDPAYPPLLREIADPPGVLFVRGRLPTAAAMVALVGTRGATAYGLRTARRLASELAARGVLVVSGLALGIDAAAHAGALSTGLTVAVLGSGLDHVGPARNRKLAAEIVANGGGLVSEYLPATPAAAGQFPARNRIVSGMCHATVVVEAPARSGALITADLALEQGREVMAVPGAIDQVQSAGTLTLIAQGAKLVARVEDVLAELPTWAESGAARGTPAKSMAGLPPEERQVLAALARGPLHVDAVAAASGLSAAVVTGLLMVLELKAFVVQLPGNLYIRHP